MASFPQLISAFAEEDGRDVAALTQFGRELRENGLLPRGKRGHGSPQMEAKDAAMMLCGITPSCGPKDAVATAMRIGSLRAFNKHGLDDPPQHLSELAECTTFGAALETLLMMVPQLIEDSVVFYDADLDDNMREHHEKLTLIGGGPLNYKVTIAVPYVAGITCSIPNGELVWAIEYGVNTDLLMDGFYGTTSIRDRSAEFSFTIRTLNHLFKCLTEDGAGEQDAERHNPD